MILSRSLARSRIARNARPGFMAAWLPVLFDALVLVGLGLAIWPWVQSVVAGLAMPLTIAVLFAVYFVPVQIVLIISSLWATWSRWQDDETTA
jgi:hypothetical protein